MPVVIAVVSSKGGCGKSTTVLVLAGAFAEKGHTVRIIDADRAARISKWSIGEEPTWKKGDHPDEISVVTANDMTLGKAIETAKAEADVVLIDVEGTANASIMTAVGYADLSLIPANHSTPDVKSALETVAAIRTTEAIARRAVHHALLWSRVPNFQSREMNVLEADIEAGGVPVIGRMKERTAYRSLFAARTILDWLDEGDVPNLAKAQEEGRGLMEAVMARIAEDRARDAGVAA